MTEPILKLLDSGPLVEARLQLHWMVQPLALYAMSTQEAKEDWSHYALHWDPELRRFSTGDGRAWLDPVLGTLGFDTKHLAIAGKPLSVALEWLARSAGIGPLVLSDLPHPMPEHAIARGDSFEKGDAAAFHELGSWFAAAHRALSGNDPSPIIWPHHFDMARVLVRNGDAQVAQGMSPGDDYYQTPYWYVTPWPAPESGSLKPLSTGSWHTKDWTGAVLTAAETWALEGQEAGISQFLKEAGAAAEKLIVGRGGSAN